MNKVIEENESQGNTSNSDNVNENGKRMKRNRLTKKQQFKKEREEVINKINNILGLTTTNNKIYIYKILTNDKIKEEIKELGNTDIKKYFKVGTWSYYKDDHNNHSEINLIKAVYKDSDYEIYSKQKTIKEENKSIKTIEYQFVKNQI
jgi:hypothetical protein